MARFLQLERRLHQDSKLQQQYSGFMSNYIHLGHMKLSTTAPNTGYYIPHQPVIKEESITTKLRVVFDASAKTSNNISLNSCMFTGPRLQDDLYTILLRWRKYKIAFTADIEKMYRQINISEDDQKYHKILWRFSQNEPIQEYQLTTVTYGTTAAPYMAVRTIQQLARDEANTFPSASDVTLNDFYVDDVLSGAHDVSTALQLQEELIALMKKGGFNLRKWASNDTALTSNVPTEHCEHASIQLTADSVKTLGIHWSPTSDSFHFKVKLSPTKPTKRSVLSTIAQLFDPMGWIAPIVMRAKMIMQQIWMEDKEWDDELSPEILSSWQTYLDSLPLIETITIPRWCNFDGSENIELHGFCDASERGYGAVVYARGSHPNGTINCTLLTSKSRVAPLKMKKTLPRLELCGATLLANLMDSVKSSLRIPTATTFAWTDSMITLAWIQGNPERWQSFVSHRVVEITQLMNPNNWKYVRTEENPADLVSRGANPSQLTDFWWNGPAWLSTPSDCWNDITPVPPTVEEEKKTKLVLSATVDNDMLSAYSSLNRLLRVIAYCRRVKYRVETCVLSVTELQQALTTVLKMDQSSSFTSELHALRNLTPLNKKSKLLSLNPFLDDQGLLRVGGRLENSTLQYDEKHPIILSHQSHLTTLLIQDAHTITLHGGCKMVSAYLRRRYWIIRGKSIVKQVINSCVRCARLNASTMHQQMGNLPAPRVTPSKPFECSGVDYAGPISTRTTKGRGHKSYKCYIAVFVCLSTKAIHIELVSDLTSNAFIAALTRFVARRGSVLHIYSDNGTQFVGAEKILRHQITNQVMASQEEIAQRGITWHFIPPASPHFGGIWEAGVKSIKHHLKRVVGDTTLTFEELTTTLCRIEACLNSRPLCPTTDDPDDYTAITPSHFLTGEAIISPIIHGEQIRENGIAERWKLTQKLARDFWKSWTSEYLARLQQRPKWKTVQDVPKTGDLVILKEDNITPLKWPMARIEEMHPGKDGLVRVVTLRSKGGTIKRPLTKICSLPIPSPKTTHPAKTSTASVLMMVLAALVCIPHSTATSPYQIEKPKGGLYIEHLGSTHIKRGTLRVTTAFSQHQMNLDQKNSSQTITQLQQFCNSVETISSDTHCSEFVHHLQQLQVDVTNAIEDINGQWTSHRTARGLLGNVLQQLFGVNDEVYADIEHLSKNQNVLKSSIQQQTNIMVNTINKLNTTEQRIYTKLNQFTKRVIKELEIVQEMQAWYSRVNHNQLQIQVLGLNQLALNYLSELREKYVNLQHAIFQQNNILDIISHHTLHQLLEDASLKLPPTLKPSSVPEERIDVTYDDHFITVYGYFTIIERSTFELIHVTPVPQPDADVNTFWIWDVTTPILAVDFDHLQYFTTSINKLERHGIPKAPTYLTFTPVINNMDTNRHCLIDAIFERHGKQPCPTHKLVVHKILWKKLFVDNAWLFTIGEAGHLVPATILCNGVRTELTLKGVGIIHIGPTCTLTCQGSTIKASSTYDVIATAAYIKSMPILINVTSTYRNYYNITTTTMLEPTDNLGDDIHQAIDLQDHLQTITWEHIRPHYYRSWYVVIICTLITVAATITTWCVIRSKSVRRLYRPHVRGGENVETAI